jgi:hypothetical protein
VAKDVALARIIFPEAQVSRMMYGSYRSSWRMARNGYAVCIYGVIAWALSAFDPRIGIGSGVMPGVVFDFHDVLLSVGPLCNYS